ncbi:unnamed protein product, partial [Rotaria magnacalcarata]
MFEPVSSSLIDDEDDEMTNEIPPYPLSTSIDDVDGFPDNNIQPSDDYFALDSVEENVANIKPVSNEEIFNFLIRIHRLIQKVRTFVFMTRSIASLQRYVQERSDSNEGGLILDVKVRWNSTFKMVNRLIKRRGMVDAMFTKRDWKGLTATQEMKIRSLAFNYDDWELLDALRDCLDPFDRVTTILSGDYPTQSMSYYAVQTLKDSVQQTFHLSHYHAMITTSLKYQCEYYLDSFLPPAQKLGMK